MEQAHSHFMRSINLQLEPELQLNFLARDARCSPSLSENLRARFKEVAKQHVCLGFLPGKRFLHVSPIIYMDEPFVESIAVLLGCEFIGSLLRSAGKSVRLISRLWGYRLGVNGDLYQYR